MSRSKSIQAFRYCQEWFKQAFESSNDNAIIGRHANWTKAERDNYVGDLHWFRKLHRTAVFPKDHPSYGTSVYDPYKVCKEKDIGTGKFVIRIKRIDASLIYTKIDFE
jgi:hypothetical protein